LDHSGDGILCHTYIGGYEDTLCGPPRYSQQVHKIEEKTMPFINTRDEATKGKSASIVKPSRKAVQKGSAFPDKPKSRDGKYEGTIGQQTKLAKF
jgi:hypothetical protein